ncbi:hypothetical protein K4F52_001953 [Lecanicillium sp. MT-2017a]|nr:hypothetical protein K4F52_001953 [Lecanicillium sp. MT-2017a]
MAVYSHGSQVVSRPPGARGIASRCCSGFVAIILAIFSRFANRKFAYTVAAVSVLASKSIHIYAHRAALTTTDILLWGPTFFAQDAALLLLLRFLFDQQTLAGWPKTRVFALTTATIFSLVLLVLATVNLSFYFVAGTELQWRNVGFVGDSSSRKVLLSGLLSAAITGAIILGLSSLLQDVCSAVAGIALHVIKLAVSAVASKLPARCQMGRGQASYSYVPQQDSEGAFDQEHKVDYSSQYGLEEKLLSSRYKTYIRAFFSLAIVVGIVLVIARPYEPSYSYMSWTLPLVPWIGIAHSSPLLATLIPTYGNGINREWDDLTALTEPIPLSWLPEGEPLQGFEDWYEGKEHYNAEADPLHISNLDQKVLPGLKGKLADIDIRHIVLIKLESTRKDVFPIKKDGYIYNKFDSSYKNGLPEDAQQRLASLTPMANMLTGDYDDGFDHENKTVHGGLNFNNAFTSATYTRKSFTGTMCGITPLVADFNVEYQNHIYQPCLPQIFKAFDAINKEENGTRPYSAYPWRSTMMQSITDSYDNAAAQLPVMGYAVEDEITKEYLQSDDAKFGKVDLPEINYYGMAEVAIEDYVRDAFVRAKKDNERVLLTHITNTTHHPFKIPEGEGFVELSEDSSLDDLSNYANAVGYVDGWLGKIFNILEEQEVADETLVVMVGDHGLAVAENGGVTAYMNNNVANFHVPLVISHPKLPHIDVDDQVHSSQILPTILDLLRETGSLTEPAKQAAQDLARNYEGQSLIRPLRAQSKATGLAAWQFSVMNPGRSTLAVRDAMHPNWRIIVPMVENLEWYFSDLSTDPNELQATVSFGFDSFLKVIKQKHGDKASKWAEEVAFMTRWWVEENKKRYRYDGGE